VAEQETASGWKRFWDRGDWWRALLAAGYYVLNQLAQVVLIPFVGGLEAGSSADVLFLTALPVLIGGVILVLFAASVGWLPGLFGRQPIRGRGWMWIPVAVVLLFNVLHFVTIDFGAAGFEYIATWTLAGLFIGFAREVLTRGFVVNMMRGAPRDRGRNGVSRDLRRVARGQSAHRAVLFATAFQLLYTFAFGICMYLALRVTGSLISTLDAGNRRMIRRARWVLPNPARPSRSSTVGFPRSGRAIARSICASTTAAAGAVLSPRCAPLDPECSDAPDTG
jgi:hypothetical protein